MHTRIATIDVGESSDGWLLAWIFGESVLIRSSTP